MIFSENRYTLFRIMLLATSLQLPMARALAAIVGIRWRATYSLA
jgi:hypothetical protein